MYLSVYFGRSPYQKLKKKLQTREQIIVNEGTVFLCIIIGDGVTKIQQYSCMLLSVGVIPQIENIYVHRF